MIAFDKLEMIRQRFAFIEAKLSGGAEPSELAALGREYSELKPVVEQIDAYQGYLESQIEATAMLDDPEMRELAQEELQEIREQLPGAERAITLALIPKDDADHRPAILEIRAGTGGDEAALFAGDLLRMYHKFCEDRGWKFEIVEEASSDVGGYKEVVVNIQGDSVFAVMKFESGVHRVQRVPATESGGRIHTSAATVAVLPEAEEVDIDIPATDIRIDTMRASGSGGQHVNTTDSAVRITHLPTGIMVTSAEKSQHVNRAKAMQVLRTRLYDMERQKVDDERAEARKGQIGSGDRSERIRTYNYPQGRVTDHRINLTLYKLDQIMQGDISELIEALTAADQAEKLAELDP